MVFAVATPSTVPGPDTLSLGNSLAPLEKLVLPSNRTRVLQPEQEGCCSVALGQEMKSPSKETHETNAWATHPGLHTHSGKPAKQASHHLAPLGAKVGQVAPLHPFCTGQADFLGRGSEQFTPNGPELQRGLVWSLSNQATQGPNPPTKSPREAALPDISSRLNALRRVILVLDPPNCGASWAASLCAGAQAGSQLQASGSPLPS